MARAGLVRVHRWAGLAMAAFLVMAGLTGAPLAFDEALDAWLNPELFDAGAGPARPVGEIVAAAERADARAVVVRLQFPDAAGRSFRLGVAGRGGAALGYDEVFVDPASARVLGRRDTGGCCLSRRELMPFLFRLHYTLAAGPVGTTIMGIVGIVWALDCFVGLCLTFPRARPFLAAWAQAWRVKRTRKPFRLVFDLHRAGGLWCWVALLVIAVSGVALTLPATFRAGLGAVLPLSAQPAPPPAGEKDIGLAAAIAAAAASAGDRVPVFAYGVPGRFYGVGVQRPGRGMEAGLGADWITVSAGSGAVLRTEPAASGTLGDRVLRLQYPLHSGQVVGLPGQVLVCLLGIATAGLAATGVWVWWRKRAARRATRGRDRRRACA
jgi:uncharacterized iron-regulated membrane protein